MDRTFVVTDKGTVLVQVEDAASEFGFYLADDDQTWPGGFGVATRWESVSESDPRITADDHDRLDWLLSGDTNN